MAGQGGFKHRKVTLDRKRKSQVLKAKENIRRVRNQFESKGQAWDPANDPAQMSALNHAARRVIVRNSYDLF